MGGGTAVKATGASKPETPVAEEEDIDVDDIFDDED
jgi:hypothetical protein